MNILITGGGGYIGSVLVPALIDKGHTVSVLDKFDTQTSSLSLSCSSKKLEIIKGDVRDEQLLKALLPKVDAVIPLAAMVGAPICKLDPINATSINFDAIKILVDLTSKNQKIIYPTTNSGYGIGAKDAFCDEESPLNPISLYGKTKVDAEDYVLNNNNGITLRLATVFGMSPRMRLDLMVNDFVYRAFKDKAIVIFEGGFRRNFIHIRDVAAAFIHAIENYETMNQEPYNVGLSSANLTKLELCLKIKEYVPDFTIIESEIGQDPDKRDYLVSNKKIENTGFMPSFSLDDGIQELLKGFNTFKNSINSNI